MKDLTSGSLCELRHSRQPKPCWVTCSFVHIFSSVPIGHPLLLLPYPDISEGIFSQEISIRAKSVFNSSAGNTSLKRKETEPAMKLGSLESLHCTDNSVNFTFDQILLMSFSGIRNHSFRLISVTVLFKSVQLLNTTFNGMLTTLCTGFPISNFHARPQLFSNSKKKAFCFFPQPEGYQKATSLNLSKMSLLVNVCYSICCFLNIQGA